MKAVIFIVLVAAIYLGSSSAMDIADRPAKVGDKGHVLATFGVILPGGKGPGHQSFVEVEITSVEKNSIKGKLVDGVGLGPDCYVAPGSALVINGKLAGILTNREKLMCPDEQAQFANIYEARDWIREQTGGATTSEL